jgi:diketogulonate reductase-like aldo/keto reductase
VLAVKAQDAIIPILGLGTWELRGRTCARIVEQALRLGYRHIDTAQVYDNEREVGEGLHASGIPRAEVFVTTKVWWTNFSAGALQRSVAESLAKLKLSQLDLVLLHWPNASVPLAETIGALCNVKREGLTRHVGLSNFTVPLLEEALGHAGEPIVANQFELHPYLDQAKLVDACRRHDVAITAYSPLARGRIRDDPVLGKIGRAHSKSQAQVTLRWLVQQGIIAIPRTSRIERLGENLQIFDFTMTEPEMLAVSQLARPASRTVDPSWAPDWD